MRDGTIVGGGSLHSNQMGEWVWLDAALLGEIMGIVQMLEERLNHEERREAVSVARSTPEDWLD